MYKRTFIYIFRAYICKSKCAFRLCIKKKSSHLNSAAARHPPPLSVM